MHLTPALEHVCRCTQLTSQIASQRQHLCTWSQHHCKALAWVLKKPWQLSGQVQNNLIEVQVGPRIWWFLPNSTIKNQLNNFESSDRVWDAATHCREGKEVTVVVKWWEWQVSISKYTAHPDQRYFKVHCKQTSQHTQDQIQACEYRTLLSTRCIGMANQHSSTYIWWDLMWKVGNLWIWKHDSYNQTACSLQELACRKVRGFLLLATHSATSQHTKKAPCQLVFLTADISTINSLSLSQDRMKSSWQ